MSRTPPLVVELGTRAYGWIERGVLWITSGGPWALVADFDPATRRNGAPQGAVAPVHHSRVACSTGVRPAGELIHQLIHAVGAAQMIDDMHPADTLVLRHHLQQPVHIRFVAHRPPATANRHFDHARHGSPPVSGLFRSVLVFVLIVRVVGVAVLDDIALDFAVDVDAGP